MLSSSPLIISFEFPVEDKASLYQARDNVCYQCLEAEDKGHLNEIWY